MYTYITTVLAGQQLADRAARLRDPLLVLDERKADMSVSPLAEADARADRDARVPGETQGEPEGAFRAERVRDRRPDEHRPAWRLDLPAGAVEPGAERVAPAAIDVADLHGVVGGVPQGHDRRDLDRLERPVVEVGLQLGECLHDIRAPGDEADAPAGHRERLGQAVELDGALVRPLRLQNRRWLVAVERDVRVREVVHDDELALTRTRHRLQGAAGAADLRVGPPRIPAPRRGAQSRGGALLRTLDLRDGGPVAVRRERAAPDGR